MVILFGLVLSLACSAGKLVVQVPTPTPTRFKTPRATYTITPNWTATFTPSPTPTGTSTPTPTETPTPTPTETPEEEERATPPVEQAPPTPAEPTPTPTPEEPTATPTPAFPFEIVFYTHDTGSPGETRITGWIRLDLKQGPGFFRTLGGYQIKALAPDGNTYLSEISGPGHTDSTVPGTGDNHFMNTKLEFPPYTPGTYAIYLVEGGLQVSPEVQLTLNSDPRQYVHLDFFQSEPQ
jgi:hypothetical protein